MLPPHVRECRPFLGEGDTKVPAQRRLLGCYFCWLSPVLAAWGRQVPVAICGRTHLVGRGGPEGKAAPPAGGPSPSPLPLGIGSTPPHPIPAPPARTSPTPGLDPPPPFLPHLPGPFSPPLPGVKYPPTPIPACFSCFQAFRSLCLVPRGDCLGGSALQAALVTRTATVPSFFLVLEAAHAEQKWSLAAWQPIF